MSKTTKIAARKSETKRNRETDRVAEQVMRMPEPEILRQTEEEEEMPQTKPLDISPMV
jgi:hypothetical protein